MPELVLHTHNLAINNGDVERRMFDFREAMHRIRPDVILAQEVSSDVGLDALSDLTFELGPDYDMVYSSVYPGQEDEQGVAIISALPILSTQVTNFDGPTNQFQYAELGTKSDPILASNIHPEAAPQKELLRIQKFREHARTMKAYYNGLKHVIAGDANSLPASPGILWLKHVLGYESAYQQVHGQEPEFTFPCFDAETLVEGRYIKPNELAMLQKVAQAVYAKQRLLYGIAPDIPLYTTDYVLTKNMPVASTASVLVRGSKDREAISDHAGITISWPL